MESNEASLNNSVPMVHKFGDEELSDVTFIVDGEEFKCHKMVLAARSTYFKAMFFSNFKEKNQDKVTIQANPVAFRQLMEIIYTGQISDWKEFLVCQKKKAVTVRHTPDYFYKHARMMEHAPRKVVQDSTVDVKTLSTLWEKCDALLKLADQFDVLNNTVSILENYFLRKDEPGEHENGCGCGIKYVIALMYGMDEYKAKNTPTKISVTNAIVAIKEVQKTITLDPAHFRSLFLC